MLMLLCVQIVQTKNDESNWKEKKDTTSYSSRQAKDMWPCQEFLKKINLKKFSWQDKQGAQTKCKSSH